MGTYRYVARVDRVGDRWRGSIPGMPVEVLVDGLGQLQHHLTGELVTYLGIAEEHLEVDFEVPGANRPGPRAAAAARWRKATTLGQLAGAATTLASLGAIAGAAWAALVAGVAVTAVATLAEAGLLSPRRAGA